MNNPLFFNRYLYHLFILMLVLGTVSCNQPEHPETNLKAIFENPPQEAKPWVFWYWMNATVSKEGITADLEAMKASGIAGAYLMPIQGPKNPPYSDKPVVQLTPEWWEMVDFAWKEAERLNLQIAMHASDGFALAGGPWITPELSMQKVVWADTVITGNRKIEIQLPQPEKKENFYKDIAVYAYPAPPHAGPDTYTITPEISSSVKDQDVSVLTTKGNKQKFRSADNCWIQYAFKTPFTCRSIHIRTGGNNYQAQRLIIESSNDGKNFTKVTRLIPPRHGWQDTDEDFTYAIEPTTAKYFRFVYDKKGTEPGAEDLDAAKWKPVFKVNEIVLSGQPKINQYESKNGSVWRIGKPTTDDEIPNADCILADDLVSITQFVDDKGNLSWDAPEGQWTILRMGHTSTGHTNYTGGGGLGLECDKFNPEAVKLQFDNWFGEAVKKAGPELVQKVLKIFHVDSWECGSQNWSVVFPEEFKKRRGYDIYGMLPVMSGLPVDNAASSENFLHDIRQTIAELIIDSFYKTMANEAHHHGCSFSAECVSPTMTSDGMLHYKEVDLPMGEFWFRSPTHDKPNDMLDAVSGAHIYGKNIIQAEGFTELRMMWDEQPGNLKTLQDRNYALGVNKLVYHVFTHNPWVDRKPGMTLNGVGLLFQRDQTWWKQGKAWVEYATRCQSLLQQGNPVTQVAVFTGEEIPRRAVLPDRLVPFLPGIMGNDVVMTEQKRLSNAGQPLAEMPQGVRHSANISLPENWLDPLNGYKYDSFNKDALIKLAQVKDGKIVLPGGAAYDVLVIPGDRKMNPQSNMYTEETLSQIVHLAEQGANIVLCTQPEDIKGRTEAADIKIQQITQNILSAPKEEITDNEGYSINVYTIGKGKIIAGPYTLNSFEYLSVPKDFNAVDANSSKAEKIAWTHRKGKNFDIYFVSNQKEEKRQIKVTCNVEGKLPELYNPVTGTVTDVREWEMKGGQTLCNLQLEANESVFLVFVRNTNQTTRSDEPKQFTTLETLNGLWKLKFDNSYGGPEKPLKLSELKDWTSFDDEKVKYYSGTASYFTEFTLSEVPDSTKQYLISLGNIYNIGEVFVNDISCGIAWTYPYQIDISKALKNGTNNIEIQVTNTWANRLIYDHNNPEKERLTWANVPYRLEGHDLLPAGLTGPVRIMEGY